MTEPLDVLIVGGGPVGCALAQALSGSTLDVGVLESAAAAGGDARPIALSHGSRLILERLERWQSIRTTPIESIHVSQQRGFGRTLMTREEHRLPALGYVAAYGELRQALAGGIDPVRIAGQALRIEEGDGLAWVQTESLRLGARLIVIAEGGQLLANYSEDYGQLALVAQIGADTPHAGRAWERFTSEGPLALLPHGRGYAMVWSVHPDTAARLTELDEAGFLDALQKTFGMRAGNFISAGSRASHALSLRRARDLPARCIAVGNAAQTLHPVAGQGLNLGLRDGAELAAEILASKPEELGEQPFINAYRARRNLDRIAGIRFTDLLVRLFSNSDPMAAFARGTGLFLLDVLPAPRRFLARRMMFGSRALP
jgi:2-octaprenyl-6-methoxyphenol hydroxylase